MARMMKIIALFAFWATAIIGSTAQVTHEVLDSQGWTIPPDGSASYTAWAAAETFTVGDTLVFNYPSGMHDVTEVTKEAYDNCDASNPISIHIDGPTSIRLDSVGGHYFICSINSHCSFGQKLAINVNSAPRSPPAPAPVSTISHPPSSVPVSLPLTIASPAPAPASVSTISHPPASVPAPLTNSPPDPASVTPISHPPASVPISLPSTSASPALAPASGSDISNPLASFLAPSTHSPPAPISVSPISHPPTSVPVPSTDSSLAPASKSTISHPHPPASALAPAVYSTPLATAPAPAPETATPAPSGTPMTYTVGDGIGWTVPPGGSSTYQTWANDKTFMVGDVIVFNFVVGAHSVAEVTKADYDSCDSASTLTLEENSPARVTLTSAGDHYFICAMPQHCFLGQKLAITVSDNSTSSPSGPYPIPGDNHLSSGGFPASPPPVESTTSPVHYSAAPLTATGLSAMILSSILALLYISMLF